MENPGSLLRKIPQAEKILFAAGACERDCSAKASDYEFFCAFCKAAEKLSHNRLLLYARALLAKNGCGEELSGSTAAPIWRFFAALDVLAEPTENDFFEEKTDESPSLTLNGSDFIPLDKLLDEAKASKTPTAFSESLFSAFLESGKTGVLVDLPDDCYEKQPSLYALEQALSGAGDPLVLRLQAIRVFAEKKIPVILFLQGSGEKTLAFFARLESLVGLSELFLHLTPDAFDAAIGFLLTPRKSLVRPCLTKEVLPALASRLYYRYPKGNSYLLLQDLCRKSCKNH